METGINTSCSEAFICSKSVYFADHVLHVRRKDANALKERAKRVWTRAEAQSVRTESLWTPVHPTPPKVRPLDHNNPLKKD